MFYYQGHQISTCLKTKINLQVEHFYIFDFEQLNIFKIRLTEACNRHSNLKKFNYKTKLLLLLKKNQHLIIETNKVKKKCCLIRQDTRQYTNFR